MSIFRFFSVAMLGMAIAFASSSANAGLVPPLTGGLNQLEDDDFEFFFDLDGNGLVGVGDRFFGVFRIQGINGTLLGPGDRSITAVFAVEATSVVGAAGSATQINFSPLQTAGANDAIAQWAVVTAALGVTTPAPTSDDTVAIIYEIPDVGTTTQFGGIPASVDSFDDSNGGIKLAELGDGGVGGVFRFETRGEAGVDDPLNVIMADFVSRNIINLDVVVDEDDIIVWGPWFGVGNFIPPSITNPGSWALATDTDFTTELQIIPEPASSAVFCGLIAACFGARRRRKAA